MGTAIKFNPNVNNEYKLPQQFGLNVGRVNHSNGNPGVGRTQYVASENGDSIAYSDKRGFVGLMGTPGGLNGAGYHDEYPPREIVVA